jgi:hypothetical protein
MSQLVIFELHLYAVDKPTDRQRWNGGPMASKEASAALDSGVEAFREAVCAQGLEVVRMQYGVSLGLALFALWQGFDA